MTEKDVTPEVVDQTIAKMTDAAEKARLDHLQQTVLAGTKEAETFRLEKEALEKKLGPNHPRVQALERARRSLELVAEFATTTRGYAEYGAKQPKAGFTIIPPTEQKGGCLTVIRRALK